MVAIVNVAFVTLRRGDLISFSDVVEDTGVLSHFTIETFSFATFYLVDL